MEDRMKDTRCDGDNVLLACMASVLLFLDLTDDRVGFMMLAVSKSVRRAMKNTFQF